MQVRVLLCGRHGEALSSANQRRRITTWVAPWFAAAGRTVGVHSPELRRRTTAANNSQAEVVVTGGVQQVS
jgi:hypothetical protein